MDIVDPILRYLLFSLEALLIQTKPIGSQGMWLFVPRRNRWYQSTRETHYIILAYKYKTLKSCKILNKNKKNPPYIDKS